MKFEFSYDGKKLVSEVFKRTINSLGMEVKSINEGTIELKGDIDSESSEKLADELAPFGISVNCGESKDLLGQIKSLIKKYVHDESYRDVALSSLLSKGLGFSYSYLSNHFTSKTFTTIENFYILIRIEKVKDLLLHEEKTLSDIAYSLNFSSVPHLSGQFKKVTGLTITQYLKFRNNTINTTN
ncbi:AraC family transcriptional regulator [Maribacter sp. PR1]|uniref:AraC family transcriptional regulator n=1 Tax=Maribacter cobaltidurans TaxID=1178778 RepID=A0ABU7ITS4_9FLAO|nr:MULTISPECIES: AraC family transcriptional regulator [Maribacter]MDC6389001.1 AraC family transcriptional regulator [Maribacter sp. PR1]MEE1976389.1 AraC family transcriptional regulator [Maribacter cobaltidurans]